MVNPIQAVAVLILATLACQVVWAGEPRATTGPALPFGVTVTPEKFEPVPDYMGPGNPIDMDFPYCPVMIDGEYWIIYKNGYHSEVLRYKGTNIENAKRQSDGKGDKLPLRAPYILGGMWYDQDQKKLYAPMHCEQPGYAGMVLREIHLASSADKGLTWKYEGALLTRDEAGKKREGPDFSGPSWNGGDGDHVLFVDHRGGYLYLYTNHYTWTKTKSGAMGTLRHRVARCAIADKMAPGKWHWFYNGGWSEPGIGGKASYVDAYCVIYSTYLKKYVSINYSGGMSVCNDLGKQDWSPSFYASNCWGNGEQPGNWVTGEDKTDLYSGGKTLFLYTFWQKKAGRRFRIELSEGQTPFAGFASALYLIDSGHGYAAVTMDPSHCYDYAPLYESPDLIESRHTRRVACDNTDVSYGGSWTIEQNPAFYEGLAKVSGTAKDSVQFAFRGQDVYWRVAKGPDCGKAEVFVDGKLQETVDCYASVPMTLQFGFIKTGLSAEAEHTIKIVVCGEKNSLSKGTAIRHMSFEYSAQSYCASDGFSSVAGKNQWYNQQRSAGAFTDMTFTDPSWHGAGKCEIGYRQMIPDAGDAVRKWVAPLPGRVRIEGKASLEKGGDSVTVSILHKAKEVWAAQSLNAEKSLAHDLYADVAQGEALYFIVSKAGDARGGTVSWDPVVTYVTK